MKSFLLGAFLIANLYLPAQIALRGGLLRPTGELGFVMKKTSTLEFLFMGSTEDWYRFRSGLSYSRFHPRLDTFPLVAYSNVGGNFQVHPGYQVYKKYYSLLFDAGADLTLLKYNSFCLYPGFDLLLGGIGMSYDAEYTDVSFESVDESYPALGYRFRLGLEYSVSDTFAAFVEACRNKYKVNNDFWNAYDEYCLGLRYTMD